MRGGGGQTTPGSARRSTSAGGSRSRGGDGGAGDAGGAPSWAPWLQAPSSSAARLWDQRSPRLSAPVRVRGRWKHQLRPEAPKGQSRNLPHPLRRRNATGSRPLGTRGVMPLGASFSFLQSAPTSLSAPSGNKGAVRPVGWPALGFSLSDTEPGFGETHLPK